ncbi:HpcH/HpaI aldolase/citrate lyase family protein [Jannaschia sp. M317]|uniref:HpcH/HpaI aldolase family protein n=1 Tax=Jannaschia sp. M317 TaxID=2867011 RepID=UPI0021A7C9A8|nr:aldolase/citrate lyase family protein [Jannaschia sp. M317]UWQ17449.1 2,4-dihydroxyhept-2-ene-1,7-dioic acid aldolase [Jannaschia sp. M317]
MRPNKLRRLIAERRPIVCGWLAIPSSYLAEGAGHSGYDCVAVDLQHGMIGFEAAVGMMQAISATPAVPIVRAPSLEGHSIMHLLDAGAYGVICPMVSTADDVRALLSACRYPPLGRRSFGPARGKLYGGADYFDHADEAVMAIPMIETAEALDNIDDILAVPGLDMIYVGPNDLALELGERPSAETEDSKTAKAIAHILARANAAGIPVGIFCASPELARKRLDEGFQMVTPGNDFALATGAMASAVKRSLGQ